MARPFIAYPDVSTLNPSESLKLVLSPRIKSPAPPAPPPPPPEQVLQHTPYIQRGKLAISDLTHRQQSLLAL